MCLATTLVTSVAAWAKEVGVEAVQLTVFEFNVSARKFYESLGFRSLRSAMELAL